MTAVALIVDTLVADNPSKVAALVPTKFVPRMVTVVKPAVVPDAGTTLLTVGAGYTYVYTPVPPVDVPLLVVTITLTAPAAAWAGVIAVTAVALIVDTLVADNPSNVAALAPTKFVPRIVTVVKPAVVPDAGTTLLTVGAGYT